MLPLRTPACGLRAKERRVDARLGNQPSRAASTCPWQPSLRATPRRSSLHAAPIAPEEGPQHPLSSLPLSVSLDAGDNVTIGSSISDNVDSHGCSTSESSTSSITTNTNSISQSYSRRAVTLSLASSIVASKLVTATAAAAAAANTNNPTPSTSSGNSGNTTTTGRFAAQTTSPAGQEQAEQLLQQQQRQRRRQQLDDEAGFGGGSGGNGGGAGTAGRRERRNWAPVPLVTLAPGLRVSKVIRGCWQLSGRHHGDPATDRTSGGDATSDLAAFHRAGISSLDTADSYGPSETLIGQYLRLHPWNAPPASTLATKLTYGNAEAMQGVNRTLVEYAVRSSRARLGVEVVDLVQLQWAEPGGQRKWRDVLLWLADLREAGLIRHIGLSNFSVPDMAWAAEAGVGVVSNQVQYSLIDRRPQLAMQQAAASYGIKLLAYGTLAGGLLADKYYDAPAGRVLLNTASKQKYGLVLQAAGGGGGSAGWSWLQEVLAACRTVAERHPGASAAAVALAWVLHQPQVAAAVVGARNARHIRDMQAACSLALDEVDMLDLDAVWEGVPQPPTSDVYVWERGGTW